MVCYLKDRKTQKEAIMLQLINTNESRLDHHMKGFVCAIDIGDDLGQERSLRSTIAEAIRKGVSSDEVLTAFSKHGIGGEEFSQNIANRFILAEII